MFRLRAYGSRAEGESGRVTPAYSSTTGAYETAQHIAKEMSETYGAAVIENTDTGNRTWFQRPALIDAVADLLVACLRAQEFIRNGIALGYISMPDADCPDPAHDTPRILASAIAKGKAATAQNAGQTND